MATDNRDRFSYPPRGMRADQACAYVGTGKSKFLQLVDEGRMPQPVRIDGVVTWDRHELDAFYDQFKTPEGELHNPIEEHYGIPSKE
jgi:predicted DNA-binding transcriptional regulator AlpA